MKLLQCYVDNIITTALMEDINYIDAAADNLIPPEHRSSAYYVAKDTGVVCGIEVAKRVFDLAGGDVDFKILLQDGTKVQKGDIIAELEGSTLTLLKGERTALNLLQHMSGIATATNKCVELVKGTKAAVTDTRKTLPGLRALQKYAVTVGGGKNHRFNLSDAAMLKDNHIDAYGGITAAVNALREKIGHTVKIEVEVRTLDELREALENKVEIIMLDNMSIDEMRVACDLIGYSAIIEASGNVHLDTVNAIASTGVDIISSSAIVAKAVTLDIGLDI